MKLVSLLLSAQDEARIAIKAHDRALRHADCVAAVADRIHALAREGVASGHRVFAVFEQDEDAIFLLAAASAMGFQLVLPYNLSKITIHEIISMADSSHSDHIVYLRGDGADGLGERSIPIIDRARLRAHGRSPTGGAIVVSAVDPVDDFLILFTSGTTGNPKAISISERLVCRRVLSVSAQLGFDGDSRVFMTGLLNNTTGIIFSFGAFAHGATLFLPQSRDVGQWTAQVAEDRLTHMMLRPAAMQRFIEAAKIRSADLSSVRVMAYGAAALPQAALEEGRRLMACRWVQGYGLSETFGPFCWLDEDGHRDGLYKRWVYCVGAPDETLDVAIDGQDGEIGEVMVRGESLMQGYCDPASGQTIPHDGWFRTGDYGQLTASGHLVLKGRIADTILTTNGHRLYPQEVETVLGAIAGVAEAVVLALPSGQNFGNSPVACLSGPLVGQGPKAVKAAVSEALAQSLSREKWPSHLYASSVPFPRNANDKIIKSQVAQRLAETALIPLSDGERLS